MSIRLLVGLHNPGAVYEATRHNAGAWFVHAVCAEYACLLKNQNKFHGMLGECMVRDHTLLVLLPMVFMNHSGAAVRAVSQFCKIIPKEILVVHDDLDLPTGTIRLKTGGGHGGHNGMRDVMAQLGTTDFHRLRIGIGHPGHKDLVHDYVLNKPSGVDKIRIQEAMTAVISHFESLCTDNIEKTMSVVNRGSRPSTV